MTEFFAALNFSYILFGKNFEELSYAFLSHKNNILNNIP